MGPFSHTVPGEFLWMGSIPKETYGGEMEPEEIPDPSPPPQYIVVMDDQTWSTAPANSEGGIMCVESVTGLDGRQAF